MTLLILAAVAICGLWLAWRRISGRRPIVGALLPPPRDVPIALAPKGGWL